MKSGLIAFALACLLAIGGIGRGFTGADNADSQQAQAEMQIARRDGSTRGTMVKTTDSTTAVRANSIESYRINAGQSRFMARVGSGGILWFLGHVHHIAMRDFTGQAQITPGATITPASLQMTIRAGSLEETGAKFTEQQKQTINNTMRNQVLETEKYPEINFKSTEISAEKTAENQYKAKISGDLTLHGITRQISIPALVSADRGTLHATGDFSVKRSDYKVKTHSIKAGTMRVRNKITFKFDIVADHA